MPAPCPAFCRDLDSRDHRTALVNDLTFDRCGGLGVNRRSGQKERNNRENRGKSLTREQMRAHNA
jgi:hypothetical protein